MRKVLVCVLVASALVLVNCALGPSNAKQADIINPNQATAIASAYAVQRIKAINTYDTSFLNQNESGKILAADLALAKAVLRGTQQVPEPMVSSVDSYVAHQSSYPAGFLSVVQCKECAGTWLMGFYGESKGTWRLVALSVMTKPAYLGLARMKDGFAPQPLDWFTLERSRYDPSTVVVWYLNHKCGLTPGCTVDHAWAGPVATPVDPAVAPGIGVDPAGYTTDLISGELLDDRISNAVLVAQSYTAQGLFARQAYLVDLSRPEFPWYRLSSGGTLRFVDIVEVFDIGAAGKCITVNQIGGAVDAILEPGTYSRVIDHNELLLALKVPEVQTSGQIIQVAASGFVASNYVESHNC